MPIYLRQSTASQEVPLGYFVDITDGNTQETALSIANTDIKIWKAGATTLANKNSGGATHISNGIYYTVLDATDTDTIGSLVIFVHISATALPVRVECCVLDENVYDWMFGTASPTTGGAITVTSGRVNADVTHWSATAVATPDTAGYPKVTIKSGTGTGEVSLSSGTVTAGTVNDKTGYAITSTEHTNIADALLKRDMSAVTGESARSPLNALRFLRNKWSASGGTLTVYKEDDSTSAWTSALTDTAGANPITASDPA